MKRYTVRGFVKRYDTICHYMRQVEELESAKSLAEVLLEGGEMNFSTVFDNMVLINVFQVENK